MVAQFINTVRQIVRSESVGTMEGIVRHLGWQMRRLFGRFPVELQLSNSRLLVDRPQGVGALVNCMGMYDYNNMHLLQLLLAAVPEPVFFDIGANVGAYSLVASEVAGSRVFAFEPHPASFQLLERNIELNKRSNVTPLRVALSAETGDALLTDTPDLSTNSILAQESPNQESVPITTARLDDICGERDIRPSVVKIDVEGHELKVIEGFSKGLRRTACVLVERGERQEIHESMHRHGLEGPFWFHYSDRSFRTSPERRAEDPLYLLSEERAVIEKASARNG